MTHEELQELLPVYVLNALEGDDAQAVQAHLADCETCRRELSALREITADLAQGAAAVEPPAALLSRLLRAVRPSPLQVVIPRRWAFGFAAAAIALVAALAGVTLSLNHNLAVLRQRLTAQEQILVLLADPGARTVALTGQVQARVRLIYAPARKEGILVATNLDDPGKEFVYQLWLIAGQQPESAGVFRPVPGQSVIVPLMADFRRYHIVAVTVERGPLGERRPTTPPILIGTF